MLAEWNTRLRWGCKAAAVACFGLACSDSGGTGPSPSDDPDIFPAGILSIEGEAARSFETKQGTSPPPDTIRVSNSGEGTLSWSLSDDADWLAVTPNSGSLPAGGSVGLVLEVSSDDVAGG